MHNSGYYVDGVLKANHFQNQNSAQFNDGKTTAKDNTNGIGFSVEGGKTSPQAVTLSSLMYWDLTSAAKTVTVSAVT